MKLLKYSFLIFAILFLSNCARTFYIQQTLENGALACEGETCDTYTTTSCSQYGCYTNRHQPLLVYIDNIEGIEYYDGLVFEVPDNLEIYQAKDFYKYKSVQGANKKVPHIVFVDAKDMPE